MLLYNMAKQVCRAKCQQKIRDGSGELGYYDMALQGCPPQLNNRYERPIIRLVLGSQLHYTRYSKGYRFAYTSTTHSCLSTTTFVYLLAFCSESLQNGINLKVGTESYYGEYSVTFRSNRVDTDVYSSCDNPSHSRNMRTIKR